MAAALDDRAVLSDIESGSRLLHDLDEDDPLSPAGLAPQYRGIWRIQISGSDKCLNICRRKISRPNNRKSWKRPRRLCGCLRGGALGDAMNRLESQHQQRGLSRRHVLLTSASAAATLFNTGGRSIGQTVVTPIYAIRENGDMLFYKHDGVTDGSPRWSIQARQIGNGWDFRQVFAGDGGAIYAIRENGDMLFYRQTGFSDGSAT